ncbi:MAG: glycosyltransferase [Candidatus Paceibacterota bacterium]
MDSNKQTCVLIVGMHRTGTSTLAGILNILGVDLGKRLLLPSNDNPKGYFEHSDITTLNREFLNSYGLDDDGILGELPTDWLYDEKVKNFKEKIKIIIKNDFSGTELFGLKDPRISILLPVYIELFKELEIDLRLIISNRSVQDVANSLNKRNGLSFFDSVMAYKYYYRIIKAYCESVYHIHVSYDDLFLNPKNVVDKIYNFINHPKFSSYENFEEEIGRFIEPTLRHNKVSGDDFILTLSNVIKDLESENRTIKDIRKQDFAILTENHNLIAEKNKIISELEQKNRNFKIDSDSVVEDLNLEILNLKKVNEDLNLEISDLKGATHNQYTHINYLDSLLKDRDAHILDLNIKLTNIERSTVWKVVKSWDFLLSLFFPRGSMVRNGYENLIKFFQNILNDFIPHRAVKLLKKSQNNSQNNDESFWKQYENIKPETDILFINHDESRTGAPRIVFDVAESVKDKYKISVVSLARGSMGVDFNNAFGPIIYPDELYQNLSKMDSARKIIEKIKPKIVYANSIGSHPFAIVAKEMKIPVIFHIHELDIAINMMFRGKIRDEFMNMADIFIAVSAPVYNVLVEKLKCPIDKVRLITAFIDKDKVIEKSELISQKNVLMEINKNDDEILIFCLGMFIYRKGADIFMKISKNLKDKGLKCKFVWIGSKPFKEPFMSDFGLYSSYFTLIQEKINPFPYMKAADIFVLPSREDPFPLVVLEAMSLGKPTVIFKDAGGIYEAVNDSGFIIDNFDIEKFEKSIEDLILNEHKRVEMGEKAIDYQKKYNSDLILPKIKNLIENLLT